MPVWISRLGGNTLLELKQGERDHARRRHAHRTWSFNVVRTGATRTIVGFRELRLTAGRFVWIPAEVPHLCTPETDGEFAFAVWYGANSLDLGAPFAGDVIVTGEVGDITVGHLRTADDAVEAIRSAILPSSVAVMPVTSTVPLAVSAMADAIDGPERGRPHNRFRDYRESMRRFGVTRHEHDHAIRIEHAKTLLRSGMIVADVAAACGYYDQSHFVKAFRNLTGLTPSQYRHAG